MHGDAKKYKFRAESPFKRIQWLIALNSFTKNLTDDLKLIEYPVIKGKVYSKLIDADFDIAHQKCHSSNSIPSQPDFEEHFQRIFQNQAMLEKQVKLLQEKESLAPEEADQIPLLQSSSGGASALT